MRASSRDRELLISVQDTGSGIPRSELPYLFEKFFRAPGTARLTPGTGLGLSICKRIIEAHRGKIDVDSEVDQGTCFTLHLPARQELTAKHSHS